MDINIALFNLFIQKGSIISIIGPNNSGKTKLLEIIKEKYQKSTYLVTKKEYNQNIKEIIINNLKERNVSNQEIKKRIKRISKKLFLDEFLETNYKNLNRINKSLAQIAIAITTNPSILLIDNIFLDMPIKTKDLVFNYLHQLSNKGMTIIFTTFNSEECLYSQKVLVLNNMQNVIFDTPIKVFQNEKVMTKLGIEIPFMIDLSLKLKDYNLISKVILDTNDMVNLLWK